MRFNFGKNWQSYSRSALTSERIEAARTDFARLFSKVKLKDKTFLDVGFGQGLSLHLAAEQGADCYGLDVDCDNLEAARLTAERFRLSRPPQLFVGSILDERFLAGIPHFGEFDVVHSWGVLHHTGDMDRALKQVVRLSRPGGYLVLAIYNSHWSSPLWHAIKWLYNISPAFLKRLIIWVNYWVIYAAKYLVTRRNPLQKERGMDFYHDVVDWVGGYPYEHASADKIISRMRSDGFQLIDFIPAKVPTGCNQFVFKKTDAN